MSFFDDRENDDQYEARVEAAADAAWDQLTECASCGERYARGEHRATRCEPAYADNETCPNCGCDEIVQP